MITVFISAFNEEEKLESAFNSVMKASELSGNVCGEVIIVNDGSTDRTEEILHRIKTKHTCVRSIHHERNMGIGTSFREALQIASFPKFIFIPGDNEVSSDLIYKLFRHSQEADLVIGFYNNREVRGRMRNMISTLYGLLHMVFFGVYIQYVNGPCIYPTERLRELRLRSKRFSIISEATTKMLRMGCTFMEIDGPVKANLDKSTSLSFKNLIEVAVTFLGLVYDINVSKRLQFHHNPVRVWLR